MNSLSIVHLLILAPAAVLPAIVASALGPTIAVVALNAAVLARIAHSASAWGFFPHSSSSRRSP